ncbi:aminotransferase class I/II-fold pyridoxal phosphate-dependent enzyme [Lacticaseibacillus zeae]|uniref:Aminotransferase class I/II-fold pyridoxal phosphate-dependent enzyme n=1 Tax=Lacticaseibacillus zeae TaxID=57037 RepID=A0A5R8LH33_LACZE|nr:aminotransferase class I/II-fold pyridoxal phosphate-dependent enzyme [Lacticaseibacillus zeae]TLF36206.1 aminotransferase class I/II-fold pyridoxal phosphate-dependent enzyme [Lacticaseibacillus zeae]
MTQFNTKLVHGPQLQTDQAGAIVPPLYQSAMFRFAPDGQETHWDYARSGNPTREYLERQIATLENGDAGFAFSSGVAAIATVLAIFPNGSHFIVGDSLYSGTDRLINQYFAQHGLTFTAVDTRDLAAVEAAIRPETKAIFFETFSNPLLKVSSVKAISALAKAHHLITIVDNTFLTPYYQRPLDLGADIVLHSATKYLGGHGDLIAGLVVSARPDLSEKLAFLQNTIGAILSPVDCSLVSRGIATLAVRLDRETANAQAVAEFLNQHHDVSHVYYPGLPSDPGYALAQQETTGASGLLSVKLADNIDPLKFVNSTKVFDFADSLGTVSSLVKLPWFKLPEEKRAGSGLTPQHVRIAIGLEDQQDLIDDLAQALVAAEKK